MSYAWDITIDPGTEDKDPLEQTLDLHPGIISKIEVKFPAGCHGMVKVRLLFGRFQIVPLSRGEWVTGDDETVSFNTYHEIIKEPVKLFFQGSSPGTTYEHVVTVRITVLPKEIVSMKPLLDLLTMFLKRLGVIR